MSLTIFNEYIGLAQGPIDHSASSIINGVCGDASLKIGDVVKLLPQGTGVGFTQADDLLPRIGLADFDTPIYGVVVGGDFENIYSNGVITLDANNFAFGLVVSFFGDGVRVCIQGRCLAASTGSMDVGDALTVISGCVARSFPGSEIIARALQSIAETNGIIAIDIKREGKRAGVPGLLFYIPGSSPPISTIARSNLDGTDAILLQPFLDAYAGVAADGTSLYVTDVSGNRVIKTDHNGNNQVTLPISFDQVSFGIAVDDSSIYVSDTNTSEIIKSDLDGKNQSAIITGVSGLTPIEVEGSFLYFIKGGAVTKSDLDGTNQITLNSDVSEPNGIAVDDSSIYVSDSMTDDVFILDKFSGDTTDIVSVIGQDVPFGVAVNDSSIFIGNLFDNPTKITRADLDGSNQVSLSVAGDAQGIVGIVVLPPAPSGFKKELTVLASKVTGGSVIPQFQLLVSITDNDLKDQARTNGFDIYFTESDGITNVPYDRESYDSATGTLVAWVLVELSDIVDNKFFMFYGDRNITTDQQNPEATWKTIFNDVFHFNETAFPYNNSSIGKNFDISGAITPTTVSGEIDTAASIAENNKLMATAETSAINSSDIFLTVWAKLDTVGEEGTSALFIFDSTFNQDPNTTQLLIQTDIEPDNDELFIRWEENPGGLTLSQFIGNLTDLQFHHIAIRYISATNTLDTFFDGVLLTPIVQSTFPFTFNLQLVGGGNITTDFTSGRVDELRIAYNSNVTNGFVSTSFDNQKTAGQGAGNFVKVGIQQKV